MKIGKHRKSATTVMILLAALLGGCLAKENASIVRSADGDTPAQNNPPTISGSPQTAVMAENDYDFAPTASDPDGDDLMFSAANLPAWASFSTSTGRVSGRPSLADVGVFENIVISVSDGEYATSLSGFSITVSQTALGSLEVSWTPPTENTDGTTLTDLAGYRIYYGLAEGNYPNQISIDTAGIASYVIENLVPDTYYVVATAINTAGLESSFSNVAIETVQ